MTENRVKIPPVIFRCNNHLKGVFLAHLVRAISNRFYEQKGYFVIPDSFPNSQTVLFPDLPYPKKLWKIIQDKNNYISPYVKNEVITICQKLAKEISESHSRENEWRQVEKEFWKAFTEFNLLTKELELISEITIVPITFGTGGSMIVSYHPDGVRKRLTMSLRDNQSIASIADMLIKQLLVVKDMPFYINSYEDRQAVGRFLMNEPKISNIFSENRKLYPQTNPIPKEIIQKSKAYVAKLGFAPKPIIKNLKGELLVNDKKVSRHLSTEELNLLKLFWHKKGEIVTQDQIFETIWKNNEEKYSLFAITKLVERLRKKLTKITGNKNLIETKRGRGYTLAT